MTVLENLHLVKDGRMTHAGTWLLADGITRFTLEVGVTCAVFRAALGASPTIPAVQHTLPDKAGGADWQRHSADSRWQGVVEPIIEVFPDWVTVTSCVRWQPTPPCGTAHSRPARGDKPGEAFGRSGVEGPPALCQDLPANPVWKLD